MSKYLTQILELNVEEQWVRVQPGVIRDELNRYLQPYGLMFGPETSTANRAMMGGMVGNNSCGANSIVFGTTRDHLLSVHAILSDGSTTIFEPIDKVAYERKCGEQTLEGEIYRSLHHELSDPNTSEEIVSQFPKSGIHRRNTGYAVDVLLEFQPFTADGPYFNMSKLIAGSEGTLACITEAKLSLIPLPPRHKALMCAHFHSLAESLQAVLIAGPHKPSAIELMDKITLDCTKENREYQKNRFFLRGDPEAILMVELWADTEEGALQRAESLRSDMEAAGLGYAFPVVKGVDAKKVWDLRKAGLGLLSNIPGDAKPVAVVEDTAVLVEDLPAYIHEFSEMMARYGQRSVYYAHAGAGELHLRPVLNLKKKKDRELFRQIATETAHLVKKYGGSLSGEHGDGRVRGEFIPLMVGEKNTELFRRIKKAWDPNNIFNPGKITDTPPMDTSLRYDEEPDTPVLDTVFNFNGETILAAAEKCNGSGDCRKLPGAGGTMCPSYMATRDEKDTTRSRANVLREFLTRSTKANRFDHQEIYEVMDLCLSCKGCTSECPSNVDMATLKAEFLHQYYKTNGVPVRARAIANIGKLNKLGSLVPGMANFFLKNTFSSGALKRTLGIAKARSLPELHPFTLESWIIKNPAQLRAKGEKKGAIYLFIDEFTNYNDVQVGIAAIKLLSALGYEVNYLPHAESGRAYLSKGLLTEVQALAKRNVAIFRHVISETTPLLGIEPSGILSFRDEYPKLVANDDREAAQTLGKSALMIEEFLSREAAAGNIDSKSFTTDEVNIKLHGHCHQKALSSTDVSAWALSIPENYHVEIIPSGCCGMAGSFGYEVEHYEVSMKVGELVLFPAVRSAAVETVIAAPGTSCRHQIKDGVGRTALHPVEILYRALV
jgi:FAD/FMN-containing dehydrogenase/Fe-S oxidoreductase